MINFKKNNFLRLLATLLVFINIFSPLQVAARAPDSINDRTANPIPINRTTPFTVYFAYGDKNLDKNINNAIAGITISGDIFEFVTDEFYDIYNGSSNRDTTTTAPEVPTCDSTYAAPAYPILPNLASTTNLTYGLQTATELNNPSGAANGVLKAKSTGCIKLQIKLKTGASAGQQGAVTFDPDLYGSASYTDSQRPARQIVKLQVGSQSCEDSQEIVNNQCVSQCPNNQVRDDKGACKSPVITCSSSQDLVNNKCLDKCKTNETRTSTGVCAAVIPTCSNTQEVINNQCTAKCSSGETRDSSGACTKLAISSAKPSIQSTELPRTGGIEIVTILSTLAVGIAVLWLRAKTKKRLVEVNIVKSDK